MTKSAYSKMLSLILSITFATPYAEAISPNGSGGATYGYPSCDNPSNATGVICVDRNGDLARYRGVDVNRGLLGTGRIRGVDVEYESDRLSRKELNALLAAQGGAQVNANGGVGANGIVGIPGVVNGPGGVVYYPGNSGQGDCDGVPGGKFVCETRYVPGYAVADMPMSRRDWRKARRAYRKAQRAARRGPNGQIIYVDADGGGNGGGGGNIGPGGIIYGDVKADLAIIGPFCDGLPAKIDASADELKTTDEAIAVIEKELDSLKSTLDEKRKELGDSCADDCKKALVNKNYTTVVKDTDKSVKNACYKKPNKSYVKSYFTVQEYKDAQSAATKTDIQAWLADSTIAGIADADFNKSARSACNLIFPATDSLDDANKCLDDVFVKNKDGKYSGLNENFFLSGCESAKDWMDDYNNYVAKQKTLDELKARKVKLTSKDGCKVRRASDADDDKWKGVGTACLESLKDSCATTIDALIAIANNPNNGRCLECEAQQRGQGDTGLCMLYGTCGMSKAAQILGAVGGIVNPLAGGLINAWMYNKGLAVCSSMYADHLNVAQQIGQPPSAPGCGGMMGMGGGFNPMMGGMMGGGMFNPMMGGMMNPMMMGGMGGMMNPMMMGGMGGMMNPMMMGGMMNPMLGAGLNVSLGGGFNPMMGGMGGMMNPMMMGGFPGFAGGMYGPGMMGGMGMNPYLMGGMGGMMNPGMMGMYGPGMAGQMNLQNQMQTSLMQMQQSALQQQSLQNAMMYGMGNAANMYGMGGMGMSPYYSMGMNPMMNMYGGMYGGGYPGMYGGMYPGLSGGLNLNAGFNLGGGLYGGW